MFGLDDRIAGLAGGGGLLVVLAIALLLGLRHATDPDHITAVSTLAASDERHGARRASALGFAWGLGHATTLFLFGLPVVLFGSYLPDAVQRAAELAIGLVIVALALRLLVRWRRGQFHWHAHTHGDVTHVHPHAHERAHNHSTAPAHEHAHAESLGRSPRAAFGIGLLHGFGGSAAVAVLLLGSISSRAEAAAALALFAGATALSMGLISSGLGVALTRGPVARRFEAMAPALGGLSLVFGAWYALAAL
jgi:ABC-type nickel/cobalt efflux system permease component RcnA